MADAIIVQNLRKNYGNHMVLNGLHFRVHRGEIFALMGGNGEGKTTTLTCMEGLQKYDSGSITINGKIGIQLQSASLPEHIKVMEAVQLFAMWNQAAPDKAMLDALGMNKLAKMQYYQLSIGQKRRLHLALALTRDPDILFLDEPTAGLDVEGKTALHEQIRQFQEMGKTIILASHDMDEVERLCNRIAILAEGKIAFIGTVEELHEKVGKHYNILIRTDKGAETYKTNQIGKTLPALLTQCKEQGRMISDIQVERESLEQLLIKIQRRNEK